jgi:hypothetical protein
MHWHNEEGIMFARVVSCGSNAGATCWNIRKLSTERSGMCVTCARRASAEHVIWNDIRDFTPGRNLMSLIFARRASPY